MALEEKFQLQENGDRLSASFSEQTGTYNALTNLGGWGVPNPVLGDAVITNILIQRRDDTTETVYTYNPTNFPTNNPLVTEDIPYTSFGGTSSTDKIIDGLYHVTYQNIDSGGVTIGENDFYFPLVGGLQCCLTRLRRKLPLPTNGCKCSHKLLDEVANAQLLLDSICDQVRCDDLDGAQRTIDYLKKFCSCHCTDCN